MKNQLKITKAGKACGTYHAKTARLNTGDKALRQLFLKAKRDGISSLGRMDTVHVPGGPLVDEMNVILLRAGNLESLFEFKRFLLDFGYELQIN
jgi:hypothetical protein